MGSEGGQGGGILEWPGASVYSRMIAERGEPSLGPKMRLVVGVKLYDALKRRTDPILQSTNWSELHNGPVTHKLPSLNCKLM